ncbi:hypothetical protein ACN4EK_15640 [Pantanalinema rosaneae CENA516]|uniref:hypothetical protein n=1 Tax=Pantanalinema rosaneae TaxID=1620701 RepID=UPI003D6EEB50
MLNKFFQAIVITVILGWIGSQGMMTAPVPIATVNSSQSTGQMISWNLLDLVL